MIDALILITFIVQF